MITDPQPIRHRQPTDELLLHRRFTTGLFKKNPGGHFKPVSELRAVLSETFVVIDNANRPPAAGQTVA